MYLLERLFWYCRTGILFALTITTIITITLAPDVVYAGSIPVREFFTEKNYSVKIDGNREIFESSDGLLFEFQHFNKMFRVDKYVYFFNDLPTRKDNALFISDEDYDFLIKVSRFYEERQQEQQGKKSRSPQQTSTPQSGVNNKSTTKTKDAPETLIAPSRQVNQSRQQQDTQDTQDTKISQSVTPSTSEVKNTKVDDLYSSKESYKIDYIFLDPGHGGRDPGASFYGFVEKDLNLELSRDLVRVIQKLNPNIKVVLTRNDDTYLTLQERCEIANNMLKPNENGIFVSVHLNVWVDPEARGIEAFYLTGSEKVIQSKAYHHLDDLGGEEEGYFKKIFSYLKVIQYQNESRYLSDSIMRNVQDINDIVHRGSKNETFYVLKGALMPAVLLELGFISNREDMELINDKRRRNDLLNRIAKALVSYSEDFEKSNGFRDGLYFSQLGIAD